AAAGPEAGALGGRGRRVEPDVASLGRDRRTGRPAVDAGRCHGGHEPAVEPPVPAVDRAVAALEVQFHATDPASSPGRWLAEIRHGYPGLRASINGTKIWRCIPAGPPTEARPDDQHREPQHLPGPGRGAAGAVGAGPAVQPPRRGRVVRPAATSAGCPDGTGAQAG